MHALRLQGIYDGDSLGRPHQLYFRICTKETYSCPNARAELDKTESMADVQLLHHPISVNLLLWLKPIYILNHPGMQPSYDTLSIGVY